MRAFAQSERAELRRIEQYYIRAGEKHARMRYVEGMLGFGWVLLFLAALITTGVLAIFGVLDDNPKLLHEFYASAAAGALGAVVSVMLRMSGRGDFSVDHELGRWEIVLVGAYRPVIGSVCGIVAYFIVRTPFIPIDQSDLDLPLYVSVAFLAGFSERWMRTMLSGVRVDRPVRSSRRRGRRQGRDEGARGDRRHRLGRGADPRGSALGSSRGPRRVDSGRMVRLRHAQDGFTLIELLTVLVLIAVLVSISALRSSDSASAHRTGRRRPCCARPCPRCTRMRATTTAASRA